MPPKASKTTPKLNKTTPYPVRIATVLVRAAKVRGLNISEIMRAALELALKENVCPACGRSLKTGESKHS